MSRWNWKEQREKPAFLALEDGTIFRGYSVGAAKDQLGEVVFNTGMTGYQEIINDPSYAGQFVTMTYPEIGNTGINQADRESRSLFLSGLIIHEMNEGESWRSEISLVDYLKENDIPSIAGIDTRALTSKLRDEGTKKAYLSVENNKSKDEAVNEAKSWQGLDNQDYATKVTCDAAYDWDTDGSMSTSWGFPAELPDADINIVAYDFGIKWNILRGLRQCGMNIHVVPAQTSADDVLALKPDGVFFSNGPADPAAVTYAIDAAKQLIGKVPVMGICLGNQLLGIACGCSTYRLKFGHHGINHPVKDLSTDRVEITSQNHNYALDESTINSAILDVSHINLNDNTVEGIRHKTEPMFAVQYHPEAGPGPHDPFYLFDRFRNLIKNA
ncbi:MAG: glutamine-hydrolyzing carbamoyl-phosphate synthase small subunit [Lentisphaeria bacterium]|nr:glutamine-hydrolyzing carbamoyl-phosphate synthase small subunit [Lentisphaeria bacterium]NQZ68908.1 glutamine-hydrolyzing carbamoyl-phosphate synthase small subunit [Lentisphaeria bacterium]